MREEFLGAALVLAVVFALIMVLANTINIRNAAYYEGRYKELLSHTRDTESD